jgi:hypothetical protein
MSVMRFRTGFVHDRNPVPNAKIAIRNTPATAILWCLGVRDILILHTYNSKSTIDMRLLHAPQTSNFEQINIWNTYTIIILYCRRRTVRKRWYCRNKLNARCVFCGWITIVDDVIIFLLLFCIVLLKVYNNIKGLKRIKCATICITANNLNLFQKFRGNEATEN